MVYICLPNNQIMQNYCYDGCSTKSCQKLCGNNCGRVCVVDYVVNE